MNSETRMQKQKRKEKHNIIAYTVSQHSAKQILKMSIEAYSDTTTHFKQFSIPL